ncbi:MAG: exodeoxyribonuclease VII large subunit [Desulfuromonas sp.]|nr:MAG: exodeoxyribonuclease VII large subunit [Desulfuromonas sp.]
MTDPLSATPPVLSVSRLSDLLRDLVEENFLQVAVEGEISNFAVPASGHFYFVLKDERAQLRAVMFRTHNRLLRFRPENGQQVICSGRLSLYPQRGELQMVVERVEPVGVGSLQLAFVQLQQRLAAEGLFAEERKRELPPYPRTVGVVTSASGAALQDIHTVLRRRGAGVKILLSPVRVQGEGAAAEIAAAIAAQNRYGAADVLIVGRGGGSLEDLWAFNEEKVARAIHASTIPVISAVGHEVDVTIADFVADRRAATPSAAAEIVARGRLELEGHLDHLFTRLETAQQRQSELLTARLVGLSQRLRSPRQSLALVRQRLERGEERLKQKLERCLDRRREELALRAGRLQGLSPLATLERGYALVREIENGAVVRDASTLKVGGEISLTLARGEATARVESITPVSKRGV